MEIVYAIAAVVFFVAVGLVINNRVRARRKKDAEYAASVYQAELHAFCDELESFVNRGIEVKPDEEILFTNGQTWSKSTEYVLTRRVQYFDVLMQPTERWEVEVVSFDIPGFPAPFAERFRVFGKYKAGVWCACVERRDNAKYLVVAAS